MPTTSNFGWTTPADTDLVKDGAAAIRTLGNGVDSSFVDLKGGTTGQILSKNSGTDLDFVWIANDQGDITGVTAGTGISGGGTSGAVTITNSMATEITAKGDLIVGTGNAAFDNLPAGTNGHVLTADSTVSPTGLKWAAPSSGGMTLLATTTLSSTTTTVSSISQSYKDLLVILRGTHANNGTFAIRTNGITVAAYYYAADEVGNGLAFATAWNQGGTEFLYTENIPSSNYNNGYIRIYDYANTGNSMRFTESKLYSDGGNEIVGFYGVNRSVSGVGLDSITYFSPSGGTIAGTALLYGVS